MVRFTDMHSMEKKLIQEGLSFASGYDQTMKRFVAFVGRDNPTIMSEASSENSKLEAFNFAVDKFFQRGGSFHITNS